MDERPFKSSLGGRSLRRVVALMAFVALVAFSSTGTALSASVFDHLDVAPIEDIMAGADACDPAERPKITFTTTPEGLSSWPGQYIEFRWNVLTQAGQGWQYPVFLRDGRTVGAGEPAGEAVSPLWVRRVKAGLLKEGAREYFIVTRCGVARAVTGLVPAPEITSAPDYVFKGDRIVIEGRNFGQYDPGAHRKVMIAEPGANRPIDIIEWSDSRITASISGAVLYGRHQLFVESGMSDTHHRVSNRTPVVVVREDRFPPFSLAVAVQEVFSGARIQLNNYGRNQGKQPLDTDDSYIRLPSSMGGTRVALSLPEYRFSLNTPDGRPYPYFGGPTYYIYDIHLDVVQVTTNGAGYIMTLYFEDLHDEFIGEASGPMAPTPPAIQLDNLRARIEFTPVPMGGLIVPEYSSIAVMGDFRGAGSFCNYGPVDICKKLYLNYEEDVIKQLTDELTALLGRPDVRLAFGRALRPWMKVYSIGEVTRVTVNHDSLLIDHIPWD